MDDDLVSSVQDALQHLFKKPKLSAKLLGKPPFRFLHDVVMAVSSATGFASTLYTDEEKDSGNYKDKAGKIDFLQKIVTLVGICEGSEVDIRCAKVSGVSCCRDGFGYSHCCVAFQTDKSFACLLTPLHPTPLCSTFTPAPVCRLLLVLSLRKQVLS